MSQIETVFICFNGKPAARMLVSSAEPYGTLFLDRHPNGSQHAFVHASMNRRLGGESAAAPTGKSFRFVRASRQARAGHEISYDYLEVFAE